MSSGGNTPSLRQHYRTVRRLLSVHSSLLERMADLESELSYRRPEASWLRDPVMSLMDMALLLSQDLNLLTRGRFTGLYREHQRIESELRQELSALGREEIGMLMSIQELGREAADAAGGKALGIAELKRLFPRAVPGGFVITSAAYWEFMGQPALFERIRTPLAELAETVEQGAGQSADRMADSAARIREAIRQAPLPEEVERPILQGVREHGPEVAGWAVRSSGVGEDGPMSFAGQYDTMLGVRPEDLPSAYREVVASRFSDRAVWYRLATGMAEVDTPMAVLFMPMVDAEYSGIIYTRDPYRPEQDMMLANLSRKADEGAGPATVTMGRGGRTPGLEWNPGEGMEDRPSDELAGALAGLARMALVAERSFGRPLDLEFAIDRGFNVRLLQARVLLIEPHEQEAAAGEEEERQPIAQGGFTVSPGKAAGMAWKPETEADLADTPEGAVLVITSATPELARVIPRIEGLVARKGAPAGHAATMLREFRIPSVFNMEGAESAVEQGDKISLDATRRRLYRGELWKSSPGREPARKAGPRTPLRKTLRKRIFELNLTDPDASSFKASRCRSVHDLVRFAHEKSVSAAFELGDRLSGARTRLRPVKLETEVPLNLYLLDVGGALSEDAAARESVKPEEVESDPFRALWRGMSDPGVSWAGRTRVSWSGFTGVLVRGARDPGAGGRGLGAKNYILAGPDFLNLNARLAYHFSLIEALVTDVPEHNYINFRFRGGGASPRRRDYRAMFLQEVLYNFRFTVDRRGDLINAWLRFYPADVCRESLSMLGRLMACARQMDMLISGRRSARQYAERFLSGDYQAFK